MCPFQLPGIAPPLSWKCFSIFLEVLLQVLLRLPESAPPAFWECSRESYWNCFLNYSFSFLGVLLEVPFPSSWECSSSFEEGLLQLPGIAPAGAPRASWECPSRFLGVLQEKLLELLLELLL
ncbi:Hypothetical protein NTJ_12732 [Nesidiocoris tenuis]|uniref:Uncharacterized protein n=1 Tax=Nesidiocoris tenuis TaxID=355587 RepID=A0ABN7B9M6_9HEMI|nr:Hypothetical protein NTJ_12732 [Nesidiocoris tenuis]